MKARYRIIQGEGTRYLEIYNEDDMIIGADYPPIMSYILSKLDAGDEKILRQMYRPWNSRNFYLTDLKKPEGDERDWTQAGNLLQRIAGIYRSYEQPEEDLELEKAVLMLFDEDEHSPDEMRWKSYKMMAADEFIRRLEEIGVKEAGNG
jgi:hypothetical protein